MNPRVPVSSVLVKPVSTDCNLACEYCFYSRKNNLYPETKRHQMSDPVLRELIAQFMVLSQDRVSFCWQGGEPTLADLNFYQKVVKYQSIFKAPGQIVENGFQSNGILIDEDWARFFSHKMFLVGVSLDGPKELHNYYRRDHLGNNSYEKVMKGIKWLKRFNVNFNILVLLNKHNIKSPRKLYQFFLDQGFQYLQFIPCVEKKSDTGELAEYSISPKQYGHFLCTVFDEWIRNEIPQVYIRDFDEILITYVTGESPNCTFNGECGNYLVVEFNGDIYPCDFKVEPKWLLGNLTEQPLEEIILSEKFTKFRIRKTNQVLKCKKCPWYQICRGGCPKHWTTLGLDHNYFCSAYQMFFKHSHQDFLRLKRFVEQKKRYTL